MIDITKPIICSLCKSELLFGKDGERIFCHCRSVYLWVNDVLRAINIIQNERTFGHVIFTNSPDILSSLFLVYRDGIKSPINLPILLDSNYLDVESLFKQIDIYLVFR